MLDGPKLDDELMERLHGIDEIKEVKFSPECTTQAKPAVLILKPTDATSTDELEDIGVKLVEILEEHLPRLQTEVKASIEHPVEIFENENGKTMPRDLEDQDLLKLRWRQCTTGGLSRTRLNGHAINKGLPDANDSSEV